MWLRQKIQGVSRSLTGDFLSKDKKDLTSIEDLESYVHELEALDEDAAEFSGLQEDEGENVEPFGGDEIDFSAASEDDAPAFDASEFTLSDESNEEEAKEETKPLADEFQGLVEETLTTLAEQNDKLPSLEDFPSFEPEKSPLPEVEPEREPYRPSEDFTEPENFADVKKFAESTSFTGMSAEGNPSFSVLIKNVRYIEDVNDIVTMLRELTLLVDPEEQVKARLMRGNLLVPRISEYAAIFLAHKLRRFDIDIQIGLSDEIHPPKHQENPEVGMVSKHNLYQNQNHHFHFDDPKLELSQIIVAATPSLEGHQVIRYLGVASEHKMLEGHMVEDETSSEVPHHYQELAQRLKAHALKAHANAVVGLNYQLTPLPSEYGMSGHKYRLSCTGNLVWVNKL